MQNIDQFMTEPGGTIDRKVPPPVVAPGNLEPGAHTTTFREEGMYVEQ